MTLLARKSGIQVLSDALGTAFDTGARPLAIPDGSFTVTTGGGSGPLPGGIVFSDLAKSYSYSYGSGVTSDPLSGERGVLEGCVTCGLALPQEWGPPGTDYDAGREIADIDLGAAPDWADYCELSVNLTRTVTPDLSGANFAIIKPWPLTLSPGAWTDCEDGCCPVEQGQGLARQFWIEIVSGRIVLRRQQSITDVVAVPAASGNPAYSGLLTHVIDAKDQFTGTGNMNRGQSNACSISNTVNYETVYTGTLLITPVNRRGNT